MTSVLLRSAAGIILSAALAFAVLVAVHGTAGRPGPGHVIGGAGRASGPVSGTESPVAAARPALAGSDPGAAAAQALGPAPSQLIVPDLVASVQGGFSSAQLRRIGALTGVRAVMPVDGGQVSIDGRPATVLGVSPQAFRAWAPPATAANAGIWTALLGGDLVASADAARRLGLTAGRSARLSGAASVQALVAATTPLGVPGADGIVNAQRAAQLGLAANVAVLINAPGANLATLTRQVLSITGAAGHVVNLVAVATTISLPVTTTVPAGTPTNYLALYQDSAAGYCPGLSWTVLAAIGQIESDHGANDGPSSAGALGPMQFMPSTWAMWGINGFGQTGAPDIMNPLDAVPSAARMLCADGAAAGGASLEAAIYDYNHADWYVTEVLDLAGEYAQEYA